MSSGTLSELWVRGCSARGSKASGLHGTFALPGFRVVMIGARSAVAIVASRWAGYSRFAFAPVGISRLLVASRLRNRRERFGEMRV